jgi:hypothetical protein
MILIVLHILSSGTSVSSISPIKKLGYKDINTDLYKPDEEPKMNVFAAKRDSTILELDHHISVHKVFHYFNVAGKETFYRWLLMMKVSKNLCKSQFTTNPSTVADLFWAGL